MELRMFSILIILSGRIWCCLEFSFNVKFWKFLFFKQVQWQGRNGDMLIGLFHRIDLSRCKLYEVCIISQFIKSLFKIWLVFGCWFPN